MIALSRWLIPVKLTVETSVEYTQISTEIKKPKLYPSPNTNPNTAGWLKQAEHLFKWFSETVGLALISSIHLDVDVRLPQNKWFQIDV